MKRIMIALVLTLLYLLSPIDDDVTWDDGE